LFVGGEPVGVIMVRRRQVKPFSAREIALVKSFAEQAAIAIEKSQLSEALATRNTELGEALARERAAHDQQTATGRILGVISPSPTDAQPVLETIAEHAVRLCQAVVCNVCRFDGELVHLGATTCVDPVGAAVVKSSYPVPLNR